MDKLLRAPTAKQKFDYSELVQQCMKPKAQVNDKQIAPSEQKQKAIAPKRKPFFYRPEKMAVSD